MKIFNFGSCTSAETKSLKNNIESINKKIKLIKQSKDGRPNSPISSISLNRAIQEARACSLRIQADLKNVDAKHQNKLTQSKAYKKMTTGLIEMRKIDSNRKNADKTFLSHQTRQPKIVRGYLGEGF